MGIGEYLLKEEKLLFVSGFSRKEIRLIGWTTFDSRHVWSRRDLAKRMGIDYNEIFLPSLGKEDYVCRSKFSLWFETVTETVVKRFGRFLPKRYGEEIMKLKIILTPEFDMKDLEQLERFWHHGNNSRQDKHVWMYVYGCPEADIASLDECCVTIRDYVRIYARCLDARRSLTGYVFTIGSSVVSWKATLQPSVALSTTEAEYMALTEAAKEGIWLKGLIEDLGFPQWISNSLLAHIDIGKIRATLGANSRWGDVRSLMFSSKGSLVILIMKGHFGPVFWLDCLIRIWNYEEATLLNSFNNHEFPDKGISKLCLVNELDDSLLLVASSDGNVRIWKDYTTRGKQKLVTAFSSIHGHRPGVRSVSAVVDWQQTSGYMYSSGEISSTMVWDLDKEQLLSSIPLASDCSISALAASQVHGGQYAAGFVDGSVRLYDIRTPDGLVCVTRPHTQRVERVDGIERVVGIGFQPGLEPGKIVSASQAGDIQFLDIRNQSDAYLTIDAHRGSLTALAIHRHAPLIASGSAKQLIKVFNLEGEQLGTIRYSPTFMAQKIGSVSCLAFHPYQILLAAGAADACVSIYADEISPPR
ncbi:regulatory-associated protein of TOR 1 [Tanacetum coccineum]|uniref:Regulatory-associated protein of TOR 1 n=1 Tax=Tanacetum coccineum TaxID=301880 RepID=A0ABQ5C8E0_9ASTR